jgi:hypothetical protein
MVRRKIAKQSNSIVKSRMLTGRGSGLLGSLGGELLSGSLSSGGLSGGLLGSGHCERKVEGGWVKKWW